MWKSCSSYSQYLTCATNDCAGFVIAVAVVCLQGENNRNVDSRCSHSNACERYL